MKVHVYLLCFNEEDIIESILRYYSSFCEKIFVMDNYSTDRSVEIAESFPNVRVIKWASEGVDESMYVHMKSQTYKEYSREGGRYTESVADWVISCDMDEVLYHPDIVNVLAKYKSEGVTVPQVTGFNVVDAKEIDKEVGLIEQYKFGVRAKGFDKRIIFQTEFNITYHQGCHPRGSGFDTMKRTFGYKTSNAYPLALLHYKHIGKRLLSTAERNYKRMSEVDDILVGRGKKSAVASYYNNIVTRALTESPLIKDAKPLFGSEGNILFSEFERTTGETGLDDIPTANVYISDQVIDNLRDIAIQIEKKDLLQAFNLMSIVQKFRPEGQGIKKKLEEYRSEMNHG